MKNCRVQNVDFSKLPGNLISAEEVERKIDGLLSTARIRELADAGYMPCWIVDEQEPLFRISDVKNYIGCELMQVREGAPYPQVLAFPIPVAAEMGKTEYLPEELFGFSEYLKWYPIPFIPPCVYFLCHEKTVVYVGQSVSLSARIGAHVGAKEFDTVFYIPVLKEHLSAVESAFIRSMKPRLNGGASKMDMGNDEEILNGYRSVAEATTQ